MKRSDKELDLGMYKNFATQAAEDLYYPPEVKNRIKKAKSISEVERIMNQARKEFWHMDN